MSNQPGDSQNGATRTLNPIEICKRYFQTTGLLVPVKPVGSAPVLNLGVKPWERPRSASCRGVNLIVTGLEPPSPRWWVRQVALSLCVYFELSAWLGVQRPGDRLSGKLALGPFASERQILVNKGNCHTAFSHSTRNAFDGAVTDIPSIENAASGAQSGLQRPLSNQPQILLAQDVDQNTFSPCSTTFLPAEARCSPSAFTPNA